MTNRMEIIKAENGYIACFTESIPLTDKEMPGVPELGMSPAMVSGIAKYASMFTGGEGMGKHRQVTKVFLTLEDLQGFIQAHFAVREL